MPDDRKPYSVEWKGVHVRVIGPNRERICEIPLVAAEWLTRTRTDQERLDIADTLVRLLNEESVASHQAARRIA